MTNAPNVAAEAEYEPPLDGIAIIGIAGRFPGANSLEDFWRMLRSNKVAVSRFTDAELEDSFPDEIRNAPFFVKARPILENVDLFDASFFGIYAREAATMDPQHRIFLELAWEALEGAGYDPYKTPGAVGVFGGASLSTYLLNQICDTRETVEDLACNYQLGRFAEYLGALPDCLATRVAYMLNLRGPAVTVQCACSTSAVAVAQACQSLQLFQSDMALAGGVSISFPQKRGYVYTEGGMASPDGICRPFDADAGGTIFGSGAGMVLLKRLDDAIQDGDHIYAVIRGVALNNDGAGKVGFTAPSVDGQAAVIAAAHGIADVDPRSIGYIECHGTATPMGDPIEFAGLMKAFADTDDRNYCALGSVKANVGHLDSAAGVTGVIKAALALANKEIPPLTNYVRPNPGIDLANSPFYVPTEVVPWSSASGVRRAGVSSFGVGGTNVHIVLEEAPPANAYKLGQAPNRPLVLPISARTETALATQKTALAAYLVTHTDLPLSDAAYTLQVGRHGFMHRTAIVCTNRDEALAALKATTPPVRAGKAAERAPRVVFMFPGQGAQYIGMGKGLYDAESIFKQYIDRGAELLKPLLGEDIRDILFSANTSPENAARMNATRITQPALFLIEYATAQLWMSWGVKPDAMVGHSIGEFAAAAISGALSFDDAVRLVAERGKLMQAQPAGAMTAVRMSEAELRERLNAELDIAAINAPGLCVVSGPFEAIEALEKVLAAEGQETRRLHTSHAFHSTMMEPAANELTKAAESVRFGKPVIPWASCVSGALVTEAEAHSPLYWGRHCRAPVRFADALTSAKGDGDAPIVLEVGPGGTLSKLAPQILGKQGAAAFIASLPDHERAKPDATFIAEALAKLWIAGALPDWAAYTGKRRRVVLPTYQFERQRYWIDAPKSARGAPAFAPAPIQIDGIIAAAPQILPVPPIASIPDVEMVQPMSTPATVDRKTALQDTVIELLTALSDEPISRAESAVTFPELGFDSLFLGTFAQKLQSKFGVKITFRQLLGDIPHIEALAEYLDAKLPPEAMQPKAAAPAPQAVGIPQQGMMTMAAMPMMAPVNGNALQQILQTQAQLLALLSQQIAQPGNSMMMPAPAVAASAAPAATAKPAAAPVVEDTTPSRFAVYRAGANKQHHELTDAQRKFIADVVAQYNAKTPSSKAYTAKHRPHLADPRAANGFRPEWKDLVYPLVVPRSKGSRLWDLDGNEYIDLVNGFGQTAFGHAPDFVQEALARQIKDGFAIGPQAPLAGEVAEMIAEMIGAERVTFCNTGSEAVMAAMRVARTVTGRDKVVVFNNDYHGQFDEVLVKPGGRAAGPRALPVAPGIPNDSVANMVVLNYGAPESLEWIRANAQELAAVIVEPIQSRHPELRPVEFLREIRKITEASETAFVVDEVVTGFRVHPGGVQALFGIKGDMATYGKVLGGGMPVGILAGKAQFMDALDGGQWQFGDTSIPEVAPTFFAGTFVRHPLVLAACKAVLEHMKAEGPALQERLAARTAKLVEEINADLTRRNVKSRLETFSSWFVCNFGAEDRLASVLYPYMRLQGVHIIEGFPGFLTTAHSEADFVRIAETFRASLDAVQAAGILTGSSEGAAKPAAAVASTSALPREVALTEVQKEVWMAAQLGDEASCAFNESLRMYLEGPANLDALRAALNDVVARHDSLRASFGSTGERMHIAETLMLDVPLIDVTGEADTEAALQHLVQQDIATPFDLARGPLARGFLVKMAADKIAFVFTAHHIICDGWSLNVIIDELSQCYAARLKGTRAELPAPLSYVKYTMDLAAKGEARAEVESFWLDQFKTVPTLPELPTDRPRPARKSFNGATYSGHIDADLYKEVKKAGARQGCTLFATLFAAFQVLAGRLADHTDVVIAVPTAGQSLLEDEILVGHCVNFLPLRVPFKFETSFLDHLKAVKQHSLAAFDRQEYTFGTLVRKLAIRRDMNRLPLTELQFNLERVGAGLSFEGLKTTVKPNPKAFSNFDIFFNVIESDDGLNIECDYATDILDEATIARWTGHFRSLLQAFVADPNQAIGAMPLLAEGDRKWLLDDLNNTKVPFRSDAFLHQLIAEQAAKTPDRTAAECAGVSLTYGQLEAKANQLARHLRAAIPAPHSRVAVAVDRSLDMLVALLAVMKAGHAYVPLDPEHPAARLRLVLDTADIAGVICNSTAMADIAPAGAKVIRIDTAAEAIAAEDTAALPITQDATTRGAYVIFTSGSTGTPKGVEVPHRSVVNFMASMAKKPGFTANDTIVAVTTISFDIAALELYLPLLTGGRVVIASKDDVTGGFGLANLLKSSQATVLQATPSLWRILLETKVEFKPGLKMLCGGEALPRDLADALIATGAELWNMYGPTETTIWSSTGRVAMSPAPITIGDPIDNTQFYILDDRDQIQPIGVPGHLYIGGDGLANGYFGRPDLTEQAFRTVSLDGRPAQRIYRTGDLARRLADGSIQMLGRIDQQVKLRGFRIELEDIEASLRKAPNIAAAAAAIRKNAAGDPRLVGYYVATPGADPAVADLATHLATLVPDYMVPTAWQKLDALPMTANGKLDRKALPDVTTESAAISRNYVAPSSEMEITLSGIWSEVLGIKDIGTRESLFQLGADSLQLFRIAARMADRGIPLQAKHLLQHPTIAELAVAANDPGTAQPAGAATPSLRDFRHGARRRSISA